MYINTITNQYPVSEADIKSQQPNTSFPQPFTPPDGYRWVFPAPQPLFNSVTQIARLVQPEMTVKGHWEQRWEIISRFTEYTDESGILHTAASQEAAAVAADSANRLQLLQDSIVTSTQTKLDNFAKTRDYDDIKSAVGYAGCSVTKFDQEGTYCRDIRAQTWQKLYQILQEVETGVRPIPSSFQDIEPLLPPLAWPN
jgi:hypothetical protein